MGPHYPQKRKPGGPQKWCRYHEERNILHLEGKNTLLFPGFLSHPDHRLSTM